MVLLPWGPGNFSLFQVTKNFLLVPAPASYLICTGRIWKAIIGTVLFGTRWEMDGGDIFKCKFVGNGYIFKNKNINSSWERLYLCFSILCFCPKVWPSSLILKGQKGCVTRQMHWWPKPSFLEKEPPSAVHVSSAGAAMRATGCVKGHMCAHSQNYSKHLGFLPHFCA